MTNAPHCPSLLPTRPVSHPALSRSALTLPIAPDPGSPSHPHRTLESSDEVAAPHSSGLQPLTRPTTLTRTVESSDEVANLRSVGEKVTLRQLSLCAYCVEAPCGSVKGPIRRHLLCPVVK